MNIAGPLTLVEFRHWHMFAGLGGGAKGFNKGEARVGNLKASFRCIGGVDNDPAAVRDFQRLAGVPGTLLDMFDYEQYVAFHGKEPPAGWRAAMPDDIRRSAGNERPHMVFLSAPCKGFSGLLPEASSGTAKYQALNRLTLRGVWLALEAWKDDPVELYIFENVPRIMKRGRHLLDQICALFRSYGYAVAETTHDCGEIGGLGQSRKRFLLVARHEGKVPNYVYEPEKRRLRGVGEILEKFPLPGDPLGGPMHRVPALQWKTWVRLAFVEAGMDWRSLNKLAVEDGVLRDFGIVPAGNWKDGTLGVVPWDKNMGTVTAQAEPTTGRFAVADPRAMDYRHGGFMGVMEWDEPSGAVTSRGTPTTGNFSVADPRPPEGSAIYSQYGVNGWDDTAGVVTSQRSPGQGMFSVADPRVDGHEKSVQLGVRPWDRPAGVVTGKMFAGGGPNSIADPRVGKEGARFNNIFRVVKFDDTAPSITGGGGPTAGGLAVADPRATGDFEGSGKYRVTGYEEPTGTVIAASTTGQAAFAVADPNFDWNENAHGGKLAVQDWENTGRTVTGARFLSGGGAVADPRPGYGEGAHQNILAVTEWDEKAKTVTGARHVAGGALSVADPRPTGLNTNRDNYATGGHYGVVGWDDHAGAVPAKAKNNNGPWSVADPRGGVEEQLFELPKPDDRLVAVIRSMDGTWHRPFTTLELAALQSLVDPDEIFALDGKSDSAWRERIGNAVPPDAAAAIASVMGTTLLLAMTGTTFMLSAMPIWVQPIALALAVDQRGNIPNEL